MWMLFMRWTTPRIRFSKVIMDITEQFSVCDTVLMIAVLFPDRMIPVFDYGQLRIVWMFFNMKYNAIIHFFIYDYECFFKFPLFFFLCTIRLGNLQFYISPYVPFSNW